MLHKPFTGPGAGAAKYDLLTALSIYGLHAGGGEQLSMARFATLITSRYNWRADELIMGQAEMARLWGIGERTVKREVKRWLSSGILICRQPGVRGRVAKYRLNVSRVCEITEPIWELVGPDFVTRMAALRPSTAQVVKLRPVEKTVSNTGDLVGWEAVSAALAGQFPSQHKAWIAPLVAEFDGQTLTLEAKSRFAAEYATTHFGQDIAEAVASELGQGVRVVLTARPSNAQTT